MGLTNFPNGITSFGVPVMPSHDLWLPKDAKTYFVSTLSGSNGNIGDYDAPYATIQQAVNQVPNTSQSTNRERGTMVYVNPGLYAEQTEVQDRRYMRFIGAGIGLSIIAGGNSTGTAFTPHGNLASDNVGLVIAARATTVTGFTFRGVGSAYGLYVGDGGRRDSTWNYDASDCRIYGNFFDGDEFAGRYAIVTDGCQNNLAIFDNTFERWVDGGIAGGSGLARTVFHVSVYGNRFKGCRGYGVRLFAGHQIGGWCTGPGNVFEDDNSTTLTNPALYEATGAGINFYVGNFEACTNEFSGQSTDFHGGNYEGLAGNTMTHVSMA